MTLEKKILPPLLTGFELATFRSRARRSNQHAIPAFKREKLVVCYMHGQVGKAENWLYATLSRKGMLVCYMVKGEERKPVVSYGDECGMGENSGYKLREWAVGEGGRERERIGLMLHR